jgi:hypothetical protein
MQYGVSSRHFAPLHLWAWGESKKSEKGGKRIVGSRGYFRKPNFCILYLSASRVIPSNLAAFV